MGVALADKTRDGLILVEEKGKLSNEIEDLKKEQSRKVEELSKAIDSFKEDATQSYLIGFEVTLEQAVVVHPTIDFSS
ncbi:hypothetical protein ACSQ67_003131 [Phaseolus vulgaris]